MCGQALLQHQLQINSRGSAADFIKAGASALGGGADLVDVKTIREGNAHIVTESAKQFIEIVRETRARQINSLQARTLWSPTWDMSTWVSHQKQPDRRPEVSAIQAR
jgi:hypothetical protein